MTNNPTPKLCNCGKPAGWTVISATEELHLCAACFEALRKESRGLIFTVIREVSLTASGEVIS